MTPGIRVPALLLGDHRLILRRERYAWATMAAEGLGRWEPLQLGEVIHLFEDFMAPWWICGGHALELAVSRSWRTHDDMDVGVLREDASRLVGLFEDWDVEIAAAGVLSPWNGSVLRAEENQNNVWCRRAASQPWCLDITIADGSREYWVFRRDPNVKVSWEQAVLRTRDGVPYLAPELQLLYKSKKVRPKDDLDAREVIPSLAPDQRDRLHLLLAAGHPWQALVAV
jgi:hypothetical protein